VLPITNEKRDKQIVAQI